MAFLVHIDDEPTLIQPDHQIESGLHRFRVVELIDSPDLYLPASERHYQDWKLKLKPNTRYHIAAKYLGNKSRDYWQPVVWSQEVAPCKLDSLN